MKIELFQAKNKQFGFRVIEKNGVIVSGGELYTRSNGAMRGVIRAIIRILESDPIVKKARNGQFYWLIAGRNGEKLCWTTETHVQEQYTIKAFKRLRKNLKQAIQDENLELNKTYGRRKGPKTVCLGAADFA